MRVLVFSDSHGDVRPMERAINAIGKFDAIIHLGDIERDVLWLAKHYPQYPLYSVLGNNDFFADREKEAVVTLDGVGIFMCHGHTRGVGRGTDNLLAAAKARGCSVALYGHTHRSDDRTEDGVLIFNPGSCTLPRESAPSFGILEIENGKCASVVVDWVL